MSDKKFGSNIIKSINRDYQIYILLLPALVFIIIFSYIPMYGLQIAFKDYRFSLGIIDSPWVGMKHFMRFFNLPNFWDLITNTLGLSVYQLIVGFPVPIILAIMINEVSNKFYKRTIQMVTYAPHFISIVVLCGMIVLFLNQDQGIVNQITAFFGMPRIDYMTKPEYFKTIYVLTGVWQNAGWGTIIYLAALASVDVQVVESAIIDGANRFQKIRYVDFPCIVPTIIILLILNVGSLLSVGFEKVLLLQNPLNMESSDIISTYVYRMGLQGGQYSFSSAIGMFNSVVNFILLVTVNKLARRFSDTSLW